jgi:hypothetical protein
MAGKLEALMRMASGAADEVVPILRRTGDEAMDALGAVAKKADDWGWKGGKKREITADVLSRRLDDAKNSPDPDRVWEELGFLERGQLGRFAEKYPNSRYGRHVSEVEYDPDLGQFDLSEAEALLEQLNLAQKADIPRAWTGKVVNAVTSSPESMLRRTSMYKLSDLMRPMTNDQRTVFVGLLPDWDDSIESLAKTVKNIS